MSAKLTLDKGSFSSSLGQAKGELTSFGSHADGIFSKLGNALGSALKIGAAAGIAAIAGVTAAATMGTKAFMEYEKSLANVGKISGMAEKDLQDFGKAARGLAIQTGSSVSSLLELSSALSSAGVSNEDLAANLRVANTMMVTLGTGSEKTGGFIGGLSKAMGFNTAQIQTYASALNVIENKSRATSAYTMDFTEAMIPLGAMFKLDEKALLAFSAVAADAGLQAGETATSIGSAVGIAMGSPDKMMSWAKLLETDVDSLKQAMDRDLMGVLRKSAAALGKITSSTEKATTANEIWGRYGMKSIGSLTGALGNYQTYYNAVVQDQIEGSKSMVAEESRVYGTLANLYDRAKIAINDFGITVGTVTQGPLKDFLQWFLDSSPTISNALTQALSGDFMGAFKTITPVLEDVANGIRKTFSSLSGYLSGILSSVNLGDIAERVGNTLADLGPRIIDSLGGALSAIGALPWGSYFNSALTAAEKVFSNIGDAILKQPWGSWASRAMDVLGQAMQTAVRGAIDFGAWIQSKLGQVNNSQFISAGKQFAGWVVDGLSNLGSLVKNNWANWIAGGIQLTGTIVTALGSFAYGMVTEIGSKVSSKASSIWDGLVKYTSAVASAAQNLGANIVDAIGMGVASGINGVLQPIVDGINSIIQKANSLGGNFSEIGALSVGTGNVYGTTGNVGAAWQGLKQTVGSIGQTQGGSTLHSQGVGGLDLAATLGYKAKEDLLGFIKAQGALGKTYDQAKQAVDQMNFNVNASIESMRTSWGSGRGQFLNGISGGKAYGEVTQEVGTATASVITPTAASNINSAFGSNGILNTLNKGAGGGVVPGNYSVTGAVTDGMKVFVTNWPGGFGTGSGGAGGANGYGTGGKFEGKVTPGGPGIGMVGSMSSTTPYANRLEVDTCEIDSFGMSPGLGAELARGGAWSPIRGSPVSEKLANEIGYQGDYSNVGNTAMMGGVKQAYDKAGKSQIATQTKVNAMWNEGTVQASNNQITAGQMIGNTMVTSATFGANAQNNASSTWYNGVVASTASQQAATGMFANATVGAGMAFRDNATVASGNLGAVLSAGKDSIVAGAAAHTAASTAFGAVMSTAINGFGTLAGSLNATALGLTSMAQYMGIPAGGAFVSGGGSGGGFGQSSGGAGSFGSGKAAWVGTGSTQTGWGAQASNAAKSQSSFYSGSSSGGSNFGSFSFSKRASGGMVNRPEISLIGEAGREAVLPNKMVETIMRGVNGGDSMMAHVSLVVDGKKIADVIGPAIIKRVQQGAGLKVR